MKPEIRGNTYRYKKQINGQSYVLTFDHEASESELIQALASEIAKNKNTDRKDNVNYYARKYINKLRKDGRSTTTINAYNSIITNTPQWFLDTQLSKVNSDTLKRLIEEYSNTTNSRKEKRSAKTVSNFNGFYKSVLAEYRPDSVFKVKLPDRTKKLEYEPTTKDIKKLLEHTKGSKYELFLRFSTIGLRRGEIGALSSADLSQDNILTINKDMVRGEDRKFYIKNTPKTEASNRRILIPQDIADMLREDGIVFSGNLDSVNKYLTKTLNELEIPHFRLHILRHFAAAYLLKNGFTKEQVLEYCGWEKGSSVMEKVYAYNLDPEDTQKPIADAFKNLV